MFDAPRNLKAVMITMGRHQGRATWASTARRPWQSQPELFWSGAAASHSLSCILLPLLRELDPANLVTGNDGEAVRCDKESG